jgi:thiosulfate/3-mercaptopyruvate sulfurtransferase
VDVAPKGEALPSGPLPSPLVSPETLAAWLESGDPDLRVVDVRWYLGQPAGTSRRAYEAGHVPGAIFLDVDSDLVAPVGPGRHPLPDPVDFGRTLEAAGISDGQTVVAYDDVGGWVAARLWWMLEDLGWDGGGRVAGIGPAGFEPPSGGHLGRTGGRVAILDGGFPAWQALGLPVSTGLPSYPPGHLSLRDHWTRTVDRLGLKAGLGEVVLIDARAAARYRGEIEPIDPVAGHIPTAVNAPTDDNLGPDGRFLSADVLRARFEGLMDAAIRAGAARAGAEGATRRGGRTMPETVTSCGSGVSACHNAIAMRVAGLPDPILYPGSYSDWSRSGETIAVGPEPGPAPPQSETT